MHISLVLYSIRDNSLQWDDTLYHTTPPLWFISLTSVLDLTNTNTNLMTHIPKDTFQNLIETLDRRVKGVIRRQGGVGTTP